MALVVCLTLIVLLTALMMAFFSRAIGHRQVESSRTHRTEADVVARSAGDYVVNQFIQEITNNSTSDTQNGVTIYKPVPGAGNLATGAIAKRAVIAGVSATDADFRNLIRQSVPVADANASTTDSTADPDANGTLVSVNRWNKPVLLGGGGFTKTSQLPNWIYMDRANGVASSVSPTVIGRFAYNVYDVSGLLDVNAAGSPSIFTGGLAPLKGTTAGADLTPLGLTQIEVDALIGIRNPDATTITAYPESVAGSIASGFLFNRVTNANTGSVFLNNRFAGRQDLLRFAANQKSAAWTQAMPYLTTFSRARNAPSVGPTLNATGASFQYLSDADKATAVNRFLPNVRATGTTGIHYKDDGSVEDGGVTIKPSSPLLQRRFSLARLAWITADGPANGISEAAIQACFGLKWDPTKVRWVYVGPTGGTAQSDILRLDQVAAQNREPNFFELLKAGILKGSLGQHPGNMNGNRAGTAISGSDVRGFEGAGGQFFPQRYSIGDRHVMQIGLNMISQYGETNYPPAIYFPTTAMPDSFENELFNTLFGIKNLPYLSQIDTVVTQLEQDVVKGWLQPELWNPHAAPLAAVPGPTNFRIRAYGKANTIWEQWSTPLDKPVDDSKRSGGSPNVTFSGTYGPSDSACLYFSATGNDFRDHPQAIPISRLSAGNHVNSSATVSWNGTVEIVGFFTGPVSLSGARRDGMKPNTTFSMWSHIEFGLPMTFVLDYKAADGTWRPFHYISRVERAYSYRRGTYLAPDGSVQTYMSDDQGKFDFNIAAVRIGNPRGDISSAKVDPRTDRFSTSMGLISETTPGTSFITAASFWPDATTMNPNFDSWPAGTGASPTTFTYTAGTKLLGGFAENTLASAARYADADGVTRPGDAWKQNTATGDGSVMFHGGSFALPRRPVVLNQRFTSLGDLGYVFRDLPFKTLDLSSPDSADAALLDLFTLQEEPPMVAGRLNPSRASELVLSAVLAGGAKNRTVSKESLSTEEASALATALVANMAETSGGPLLNTADLVSRLSKVVDLAAPSNADKSNKAHRESALRALASVSDTRTWNFLIDVIAQSGKAKFSKSVKTGSDFRVQGEMRYWLHVAVDRYTGEIVDRYFEPIYE